MTLHEAMLLVLREHGGCMHAADLAGEIAVRGLYVRKVDGLPAQSRQLRARARRYPALFSVDGGAICLLGL